MFRTLIGNTLVSGIAYLAVSLAGLITVPILVNHYGLSGFGLITLARLFLPTSGLSFIDFGFGEVTTQAVARARETGDKQDASQQFSYVLACAVGVGTLAGVALGFGADRVAEFLAVAKSDRSDFVHVLEITAAALPALFASLAFEGVIKGFERYGVQRACEVVSAIGYAAGAILAAGFDAGFQAVCLAMIASQMFRLGLVVWFATRLAKGFGLKITRWGTASAQDAAKRSRVMAFAKMIGALQTQAAPLLIGLLINPAAVGAYDVLARLPRFAKAVLGLLSSTLLPFAVRLDASRDHMNMKRLGQTGLFIVMVIAFPPLTGGMIFSKAVLANWIGPSLVDFWGWQSAMFVVPILTVMVGFGGNALLGRVDAATRLNRLTAIQLIIQFGLALAFEPLLRERAFILGQVLAVAATFPWQIEIIRREQRISPIIYGWLFRHAVISAILGAIVLVADPKITGLPMLAAALVGWACAYLVCAWFFILTAKQRARVFAEMLRFS